MSGWDTLITIGILFAFGLTIYLKVSKQTFQEVIKKVFDLIKGARK